MLYLPQSRYLKLLTKAESADDVALSSSPAVAVADDEYRFIFELWVSLDAASEADYENLDSAVEVSVTIGSTVWSVTLHPFEQDTETTPEWTHVDVGPWFFDFGHFGLGSGVRGDDIVVAVGAAGTGIKTKVNYTYA